MEKLNVALLYGGRSGEYEVSLRSAAWFYTHADKKKYNLIFIGITREGVWYLQPEDIRPGEAGLPLTEDESKTVSAVPGRGLSAGGGMLPVDIVLPILHGTFGEDGTVQGLLELANLPYTGADVPGCALSIDKEMIKRVWEQAGLPIVPFHTIRRGDWTGTLSDRTREILEPFGMPLFIKPAHTGSSVGVSRAETWEQTAAALDGAFLYDTKVIIEPCITAREIECSVIGNNSPRSFVPGEIVSSHTFYDYQAKYTDPRGAELLIPAPLSEALRVRIESAAREAYGVAGLTGMARVDFFLEVSTDRIYINELNAIPGFTSISMFPRMCENGGMDAKTLVDTLVGLGLERFGEKKNLKYSF